MNNKLPRRKTGMGIELLAPAGSPEAGYAALHYGADAVYLGLGGFSARASAVNFSLAELADIVGYAHSLPKRRNIYAAVNTLVLQKELGGVIDLLADIAAIGVDAVIVQDLGVLSILRRYFPQIKIHASTQMAIHNRQGVEAAVKMGMSRVTLARELTLSEIAGIAAVPGIETEVFVHGALCYSYSGLCLFSSHLSGRSGNRGRCAYPCREWFRPVAAQTNGRDGACYSAKSAKAAFATTFLRPPKRCASRRREHEPSRPKSEERMPQTQASPKAPPRRGGIPTLDGKTGGFIFSMKDLALPEYVAELRRIGVTALKIEGRMKSALYVAAVVNYYRKLIDGRLTPGRKHELAAELKTIYSRPWTELYLKNRKNRNVIDPEIVGHRGFPTGKVEKIVKSAKGYGLRFKTATPIELHDGLQIDIKGWPRPFGFAVKSIYVQEDRHGHKERRVFAAPSGSVVEVPLPRGHPAIPLGAVIYSSSSQQVKQKYKFNVPKAGQYRPRQTADFQIRIDSKGFEVVAKADSLMEGHKCCRWLKPTPACGHPSEGGELEGRDKTNLIPSWPRLRQRLCRGEEGQGWGDHLKIEIKKRFDVALQAARDLDQIDAAIESAFAKLGDTNLKPGKLVIDNPEALFIPVSLLNAARREITAALERKIAEVTRQYAENVKAELDLAVAHDQMMVGTAPRLGGALGEAWVRAVRRHKTGCLGEASLPRLGGDFKWSVKTDQPRLLAAFGADDWKGVDEVILELPINDYSQLTYGHFNLVGSPLVGDRLGRWARAPGLRRRLRRGESTAPTFIANIERLAAVIGREKIRFALPVIMREWETENILHAATDLILKGWKKWQVANLGGLALLRSIEPELDISADWPVYAMNLAAIVQLKAMGISRFTLSPEDGLENMRSILSDYASNAVVIVYQDTPLMISETCVFAVEKCPYPKICGRREALFVSPRGDRVRVVSRACRNEVLHVQPFSLAGHLDELASAGALNLMVDFMARAYSGQELLATWRRLRSGAPIPWGQAANFRRGLR